MNHYNIKWDLVAGALWSAGLGSVGFCRCPRFRRLLIGPPDVSAVDVDVGDVCSSFFLK